MFRTFWDEFWHLNASQRSASLILLLILIGLLFFQYKNNQQTPPKLMSDQGIISLIDSLENDVQLSKEKDASLLANYMPDTSNKREDNSYVKFVEKKIDKIPLNQIDTAFIHAFLYPKTTARIIKYRNSLGGFYDKTQLKEVYGISDALYTKLEPHITIDKTQIQSLDINTQTFQEINKHPYIDYETTKLIVNARKKKKLTSEDLKILLDNELYLKIVPYIKF